ncbi:TonB-dependent receptor [Mucilaginibacter sp.]
MKKLYLLLLVILITLQLFAQGGRGGGSRRMSSAPLPPPIPFREVSGIVKDSTDSPIVGSVITLTSKTDTLRTATNVDGIFVFKNVKAATFFLSITEIGYDPSTRKYLNNDASKKIVLDPIILKSSSYMLKEVKVNGTPSITYKTDTVEYKASDYKVRENATVDDLLRKMEGMEVGSDGTLTHQGQQVTKARLNGKDYTGGNVAQAIQNLPADIVDKIQIVDDYGDEAARTGVKDGTPQKVLNITTRADRSVGNIARATAGAGSDDRFDERLFLQRINANQQISIIGVFKNTINGVASTGINSGAGGNYGSSSSSGGTGGTTKTITPTFSYRDDWSKKIEVNMNYGYTYTNVNSINQSDGVQLYAPGTINQQTALPYSASAKTNFINNSVANNITKSHTADFDMEYNIDSSNYMRFTPTYSFAGSNSDNISQYYQTGVINQTSLGNTDAESSAPSYGAVLFYQHLFKKKRRNISLQLSYTHTNQEQVNQQNNHILYYADSTSLNTPFLDSLVHRVVQRGNISNSFRASLTYVEPLSLVSQFEINSQLIYRGYDNNAFTNNVDSLGRSSPIDSLTNIYHYSFTEEKVSLNYRLNKPNYNLSLGIAAIPTLLQGARDGYAGKVDHSDFSLIPIFRYQYSWSRQEKFSIYYTGTPIEPTFNELQPYTDLTNPQNPVIGNPNLKPSFTNALTAQYNNYIANSQLNLSANVNASTINNQVVTNNILVPIEITNNGKTSQGFITDTHYLNLSGAYAVAVIITLPSNTTTVNITWN